MFTICKIIVLCIFWLITLLESLSLPRDGKNSTSPKCALYEIKLKYFQLSRTYLFLWQLYLLSCSLSPVIFWQCHECRLFFQEVLLTEQSKVSFSHSRDLMSTIHLSFICVAQKIITEWEFCMLISILWLMWVLEKCNVTQFSKFCRQYQYVFLCGIQGKLQRKKNFKTWYNRKRFVD